MGRKGGKIIEREWEEKGSDESEVNGEWEGEEIMLERKGK